MSSEKSTDSEDPADLAEDEDSVSSNPTQDQEAPEQNPEDVIRKIAEKKPEMVEAMAMMASGPMAHPLHQKMNEGHIATVLDLAVKHDGREFELAIGGSR